VGLLTIHVSKKFGVPLDRFFLDTSLLELDGEFTKAPKVVPGRGRNSFSQLIASLTAAAGSRIPIKSELWPGNTFDGHTLPNAFKAIDRVAPPGFIELIMDRAFPTLSNILFLQNQWDKRPCYWISPLKTGLAGKHFKNLVFSIWESNSWQLIEYRSAKEIRDKIPPSLTAYETTWVLKEEIKPELAPGQKRRPNGSIRHVEIPVRCVIFRHEERAVNEKTGREANRKKLDMALQGFQKKINLRSLKTVEACENSLRTLLNGYKQIKSFVNVVFSTNEHNAVIMNWTWDEVALAHEEKLDGIFALLTNYDADRVSANKLIKKYRERNQIEVNFKDLKGLLDLERIFLQLPERIEAYVFPKTLAYFVLAFLRWYAEEKGGIKTTEKKIQESFGDMLLIGNKIQLLDLTAYSLGNDTSLAEWFWTTLGLPNPIKVVDELNSETLVLLDQAIDDWYKTWLDQNAIN
jgi:transposase